MNDLLPLAETIAARLKARHETIAVAESSTGGLIAAALLAVPGASAYFLGGAVAYTRQAQGPVACHRRRRAGAISPCDRAARAAVGAPRAGAIRRHMGDRRERRHRSDRQSLRRRRPGMSASPSRGRPSGRSRWKPAARSASPICAHSPPRRLNCLPVNWPADGCCFTSDRPPEGSNSRSYRDAKSWTDGSTSPRSSLRPCAWP